jgi:hypothetical protein
MKKYAVALVFALAASNAFAVDMPSITSNTTRDGSANPVNNSTSMGNDGGTQINGNSPVIIDPTGRQSPDNAAVTPTPTPGATTVHAHHHRAGETSSAPVNPPGDEDPMGAGR